MILLMIGTTEIILIVALVLLLFGGKKLPELMRGMGKGVKSFKQGLNEPDEPQQEKRNDKESAKAMDETDHHDKEQ